MPRKLAVLNDRIEFGPPKSDAGVRVITLPAAAVKHSLHLTALVDDSPGALILSGPSGASTRQLMHRMDHSTMRAALIYQYARP